MSWTQKANCCFKCKHATLLEKGNYYWCEIHGISTKPWRVCDNFAREEIEIPVPIAERHEIDLDNLIRDIEAVKGENDEKNE